jgi:hypothetical protein
MAEVAGDYLDCFLRGQVVPALRVNGLRIDPHDRGGLTK